MEPIGKFVGHTPNGMGLANTAILASLLDHLLMRGILRPIEVTDILDNAHRQLSANSDIAPVTDAMDIVSKLRITYQNIEQITS
jgi:hypothetical protein